VRLRQMPVSVRIFRSRQFIYRPPCVFRRDEGMLFYSRDALFLLERERENREMSVRNIFAIGVTLCYLHIDVNRSDGWEFY
jgi:hypothetical protein